jgi:hypothetical protein
MHKVIYLSLLLVVMLAPVPVFAQMGSAAHYSNIWIDDSGADPTDGSPGIIYIRGLSVTQDDVNPYGHSYDAYNALYIQGGGLVAYDGGGNLSHAWNGNAGAFNLIGTHRTSCPICACEWNNSSGSTVTISSPGYSELYYNFENIIFQTPSLKRCGYKICEWSKGCFCHNFLRNVAWYDCACTTPCAPGLRLDFRIATFSIPFIGDKEYCQRIGLARPLNFDPCVAVPPWNPDCSITNEPKP